MDIPTILKSPATAAIVGILAGGVGSELRQRTATELAVATLTTRVVQLEQRSYVSKDEFSQFSSAVLRKLDDLTSELRARR